MQRSSNRELWLAFIAILIITILYLFVALTFANVPRASGFFGHSIGILGFVLMLMTETLYSIRKRSRSARWGRMSEWLNFHIFTGIVGPYMVLLHTSWKFNGLAGLVMLMTVIIVASGFVGRYIYTAVPRSVDGAEIEAGLLEQQARTTQAELEHWLQAQPEAAQALGLQLALQPGGNAVSTLDALEKKYAGWSRLRWWWLKRSLPPAAASQVGQLQGLLVRRRTLRRQLSSLATARRLLALWHAIHIPIGMVLFTAAFIHIIAAIYYATLLH